MSNLDVGNRDIMINRITDSKYAYYWAKYIGNRDVMIDRVTDSGWVFMWTRYIGPHPLYKKNEQEE